MATFLKVHRSGGSKTSRSDTVPKFEHPELSKHITPTVLLSLATHTHTHTGTQTHTPDGPASSLNSSHSSWPNTEAHSFWTESMRGGREGRNRGEGKRAKEEHDDKREGFGKGGEKERKETRRREGGHRGKCRSGQTEEWGGEQGSEIPI